MGYSLSDIVLTARDIDGYRELVDRVLADHDIPVEEGKRPKTPSAALSSASTLGSGRAISQVSIAQPDPNVANRLPRGETPLALGVTQIVDFLASPEKYRLKWVLGLEEPLKSPATPASR